MWSIVYFRRASSDNSGVLHTLKVENGVRALEVTRQLMRSGQNVATVMNDAGVIVLDSSQIADLFGDKNRTRSA